MAASAFTTQGLTYFCASLLTTKRVDDVAAAYQTWLTAQVTQASAQNALLAAAGSSKNPDRVLAKAAEYYAAFEHDPPTITSITPATGTTAGGTAVVIRGTNLAGTTSVTFGGTAGTALVNVSDTEVHVTTPAKTAGAKDVIDTTPDGAVTSTGGFTYA